MKRAEEKMCECVGNKEIIQLPSIDVTPHELESLEQYYCIHCNSFWREA